jgi:hypothetical protein
MKTANQINKSLLEKGFITEETAAEISKDIKLYLERKVLENERLINDKLTQLKAEKKPFKFTTETIKRLLS